MPKAIFSQLPCSSVHLTNWRKRDYQLLKASGASNDIKEILLAKVARRSSGSRFFGEAYVAASIVHRSGYYSSFKWLTNSRFLSEDPFPAGPAKTFQERLRKALHKHFGHAQLEKLQTRARRHYEVTGVRAVAPDLWLIDRQSNHRFIEVKLPRDRVGERQLAGMRLIRSCLRAKGQVSVEVIELRPEEALAETRGQLRASRTGRS
jgi:hypothetical protein